MQHENSMKTNQEIVRKLLLNKLLLLLFFSPGEEIVHFTCCWYVSWNGIQQSSVCFNSAGRPSCRARGSDALWISYQTARRAFPGAPVTEEDVRPLATK